jgi:hypothetical protein
VEDYGRLRRLIANDVLTGAQFYRNHYADQLQTIPLFTPWDPLPVVAAHTMWRVREQPLTYHHTAGPVGAVFRELRTRRGGADAKAPVGAVGLGAGELAAYARPGQTVTFYETRPELKKLVADVDEHFTYIADARRRGAEVEVRVGDVRRGLEQDAGRKYAVLVVEMYDTGFDPGDRLTLEAVRLYADRVSADGIVALHISNKDLRLEPVVAEIAGELKLAGRACDDEVRGSSSPGKVASSWVVLARTEAALGGLGRPVGEQVMRSDPGNPELARLLRRYGPDARTEDVLVKEYGDGDLDPATVGAGRAAGVREVVEHARPGVGKKPPAALIDLAAEVAGPVFRPLRGEGGVGVRRDGDARWPPAVRRRGPVPPSE